MPATLWSVLPVDIYTQNFEDYLEKTTRYNAILDGKITPEDYVNALLEMYGVRDHNPTFTWKDDSRHRITFKAINGTDKRNRIFPNLPINFDTLKSNFQEMQNKKVSGHRQRWLELLTFWSGGIKPEWLSDNADQKNPADMIQALGGPLSLEHSDNNLYGDWSVGTIPNLHTIKIDFRDSIKQNSNTQYAKDIRKSCKKSGVDPATADSACNDKAYGSD